MPKRRRMIEYAKEIGAVNKSGRVNWQAVAESLAQKYEPGLLEGEPGPGVGRPKRIGFESDDDAFLSAEIEYVKITSGLSSDIEACKKISKNKFGAREYTKPVPEGGPDGKWIVGADGRVVVKWEKARFPNFFQGINPETLKRRYLAFKKLVGIRGVDMKVEIPNYRALTAQDRIVAQDLKLLRDYHAFTGQEQEVARDLKLLRGLRKK